jgi:RNA polymerase sigma-70 factor (ECF subfamily)
MAHPPEADRLLGAARTGDEAAFAALVAPFRAELHAHCYRMLASVHDAEDALQETLLRAWRGLGRFEGRSSLRSWLYTIATNTSLNLIARRPKRVLPIDLGPRTDPELGPGEPVVESIWIEPYPDEHLAAAATDASPEARYELRESVELAFVAALQHLPASQRAVLILREVLGFSAQETAEALGSSVASVNSALQRARRAVQERTPEQSQQQTLRALGDERLEELVTRYVEAWERDDVQAVVALLADDAAIAMPPLRTWFGGTREEFARFLELWPLNGQWRWKTARTRANGQPAIGFYAYNETLGYNEPFALNVLSFRGDQVSDVVAFVARAADLPASTSYGRWPDRPPDPDWMQIAFGQFGLPDRL